MRFIHDNLYPLVATLIFIEAATCWFGVTVPSTPGTPPQLAEPWNLPEPAKHDSQKSIAAINARNLWNVEVAADAQKKPEWRVLGIARSGADRFVLLAFDGKPIEILKVGDALPDGVEIVQIEKDRFFVMTSDNKKLAFGIYKHDQAK